ncbi:MAG: hypothetical protein WAL52_09195 [Candidatus Sulfotelmatobacter sp.]
MGQNIVQEILHELFASLEALDTQTTAIRQFLKDKGIATDQELAPYLKQAGNASGVRWLAVRVRIDHLLSSAIKPAEGDKKAPQPAESENGKEENRKESKSADKVGGKEVGAKDTTVTSKVDTSASPEAEKSEAGLEKDRDQIQEGNNKNEDSTKNAA